MPISREEEKGLKVEKGGIVFVRGKEMKRRSLKM